MKKMLSLLLATVMLLALAVPANAVGYTEKVQCEYDSVADFSEGFAVVEKAGKYGFIDTAGKEVVPCRYSYAWSFSNGFARVSVDGVPPTADDKYGGGKLGFVDATGKEIVPCKYDKAHDFEANGLALVVVRQVGIGYVDGTGKEVIPCKYHGGRGFSEGFATVNIDGKWGFIDETGKEVTPLEYDYVYSFNNGCARVQTGGKWGYIDTTCKLVIPCIYEDAHSFYEGLARVELDGKWGFIDQTGATVIPFKYDAVSNLTDGLARVTLDGKAGVVGKTGNLVIPIKYDDVLGFCEGLSAVELDGRYGVIDLSGKEIVPCIYEDAGEYCEGLLAVKKGGKWGFIDTDGKLAIPCRYDYVEHFTDGVALVNKGGAADEDGNYSGGKWGFIDKTGAEAAPCVYDDACSPVDGLAAVELNGKWGFVRFTAGEAPAEPQPQPQPEPQQGIRQQAIPFYILDEGAESTFDVWFIGGSDVPYVSLSEWAELLDVVYNKIVFPGCGYSLDYTLEGDVAVFTREDGYTVTFDCANDTIVFFDYDAFIRANPNGLLIDILGVDDPQGDEPPELFKRCEGSYERYGDMLTLDLAAYGIDMVTDGEEVYVPMQTLNDFLLSHTYLNLYYNGKLLFLGSNTAFGNSRDRTAMGKIYYDTDVRSRSKAMAEYTYAELCLALDNIYGLKDVHNIRSFDSLALQTGLKDDLMSTDPVVADTALYNLITFHIDDLHSAVRDFSPLCGDGVYYNVRRELGSGYSYKQLINLLDSYSEVRSIMRPDGIPCYEEIGNTAYITFDHFETARTDYYETPPTVDVEDTVGIMLYAYSQIMRENSPIENVVLDLSCNTGGESDAAIFVISAFLGEGTASVMNSMTGALATGVYRVDMNLDHKFDEKDLGLTGKNLYCLTSPASFSCGNLVPNVFKNSTRVTLIGRASGGGSCCVYPMTTACGATFQISGFMRLAFVKNGSFYDIDRGADPDFSITKLSTFYDRTRLTAFILSLP